MAALDFPANPTAGQVYEGDNGVIYTYVGTAPNGHWSAFSELSSESFADIFVEVAGDNMTGDLTLGTDKITLKAADGSITAARLTAGDLDVSVGSGKEQGVYITSSGYVAASRAEDRATFVGYATGNDTATWQVVGGGYTQQAGDARIGTTGSFTPSSPAISLNATDGSASFKGTNRAVVYIQTDDLTGSPANGVAGTMLQTGTVFATRGGNTNIWEGRAEGSIEVTSSIKPDGQIIGSGRITAQQDPNIPGGNGFYATAAGTPSDSNAAYLQLHTGGSIWATTGGKGLFVGLADRSQRWGNFTPDGNFHLGGTLPSAPNITLNSNGSAKFAGIVNVGSLDGSSTTSSGVQAGASGYVRAQRPDGDNGYLWRGNQGTATTSYISANGSAQFGNWDSQASDTEGAFIYSVGSYQANRTSASASPFKSLLNGDITFEVRGDGRVTAAGEVTIDEAPSGANQQGGRLVLGTVVGEALGDITTERMDLSYRGNMIFKTHQNPSGALTTALTLDYDQNASFTGSVKIGGTLPSSPNITLSADGSIVTAGTAYFGSYQSNANWDGTDTVDQATLFVGGSNSEISGIRVSNTNYAKESEAYLDLVNFGSKNLGVYSSYRLSGGTGATSADENDYFKISRLKAEEDGTTTLIERLSIDNDGDIKIGGSVSIGGTADANTIDEYEEGTWTATVTADDGSPQTAVVASSASYRRIGATVTCYLQLDLDADDSTDNFKFSLPFTTGAGGSCSLVQTSEMRNDTVQGYATGSTMRCGFPADLTGGSKTYRGSFTYRIN